MYDRKIPTGIILTAALLFFSVSPAIADYGPSDEFTEKQLAEFSSGYEYALQQLESWLSDAPPPGENQARREKELKGIDQALYFKEASKLDCVGEFFDSRMRAFMQEYGKVKPGGDTLIWKLYNHTEIIQTDDVSIVIDLIKGFDKIEIPD